jgi:hypothetical protein
VCRIQTSPDINHDGQNLRNAPDVAGSTVVKMVIRPILHPCKVASVTYIRVRDMGTCGDVWIYSFVDQRDRLEYI